MSGSEDSDIARQAVRFAAAGVAAFLVDYGTLMALTQGLGWDAVVAAAVSFTISLALNYLLSMRYVFKRRNDIGRGKEAGLFAALSLAGLGINEAVMAAGTRLLGTGPIAVSAVKVAATGIVMVWNFLSRKRWVEGK